MSLQLRLTLLFLVLAAPVLTIFGATVYLVSRDRLYAGVDQSLLSRAQTVHSAIQRSDGPLTQDDIDSSRRGLDRLSLDGASFEVLDPDFHLLYSSNGAFSDFRKGGASPAAPAYATARLDDSNLRVLTLPLESIGKFIGYVEATNSLQLVDSSLSRIRQVLILGALIVLVVTAFPAYLLAGRAIDPVRKVSRLARELEETADFSRRLERSAASGEMQELTDTFNRMVERVEKMIQAQRAFLADSSHELRRPLTLLRTNIDVINDPGLSEDGRRQVESEMRNEAEAMSRLVSNLVLLSREGQLAFALGDVDLSELCERCIDQVRLGFPRHRFLAELTPEVWASLDEERFSQVLTNLLQNAATYSPKDGIVLLSLHRDDDAVLIEVVDYGFGMNEADVAHAFDRFYRGGSARELRTDGFGLGLAIVRHVVEAHHGRVELSSHLGEGTRVRIRLPLPVVANAAGLAADEVDLL